MQCIDLIIYRKTKYVKQTQQSNSFFVILAYFQCKANGKLDVFYPMKMNVPEAGTAEPGGRHTRGGREKMIILPNTRDRIILTDKDIIGTQESWESEKYSIKRSICAAIAGLLLCATARGCSRRHSGTARRCITNIGGRRGVEEASIVNSAEGRSSIEERISGLAGC